MKSFNVAPKMSFFVFLLRCSYILDANGESRSFRPRDRDEMVKQVRPIHGCIFDDLTLQSETIVLEIETLMNSKSKSHGGKP